MKPVKKRGHFAIKFTAAVMRVVSLLIVIGGVVGGLAFTQFQNSIVGGLPGAAAAVGYLIAVVFTFIYAIILWGFADALVLIADTNDAQRVAEQQIATLMLERRTEPAVSYVAPAVPSDTTERLPPPDR